MRVVDKRREVVDGLSGDEARDSDVLAIGQLEKMSGGPFEGKGTSSLSRDRAKAVQESELASRPGLLRFRSRAAVLTQNGGDSSGIGQGALEDSSSGWWPERTRSTK